MSDGLPRHGDPDWTRLPPGSRFHEPPDEASAAFIAECADDPDLLAHALVDAQLDDQITEDWLGAYIARLDAAIAALDAQRNPQGEVQR